MSNGNILIAAEDQLLRRRLREHLLRPDWSAELSDAAGAQRSVQQGHVDLVIIVPPRDDPDAGIRLGKSLRETNPELPLVLLAGRSSEEVAIAALRAGITDYVRDPYDLEEVAAAVERCLSRSPRRSTRKERTAAESIESFPIVGESASMREIKTYIGRVASTASNVLLTGETGTGKELVAEWIHRSSPRRERPFLCINCAALPDGLLESELFGHERGAFTGAHAFQEGRLKLADGGTALLDEVGDMSPEGQAKILRVIESKEVHRLGGRGRIPLDIRFIAATNQDLEQRVAEGVFRKDLFFRLNVARMHLPPLRERREDIPLLCAHYLGELNRKYGRSVEGFTAEASEMLFRYNWPGNVRELKNLLEAVFINLPSRQITLMDLPEQFRKRLNETAGAPQDERDRLLSALFSTNWNKSRAAEKLCWSRMTLYRKLAKYNLTSGGGESLRS